MKTGLELNELAVELQRRAESAEDFIADTRRIGFYVAGTDSPETEPKVGLTIDGAPDVVFGVNEYAQNQIAQRLGIPFRFFERMRDDHDDILQDTVTKLFVREPERRMIRTLDETARAFLSDRYRRIDNYDVASRAVFPALAEADQGFQVMSANLTDTRMYVKLIWPEISGTVVDAPGRERILHPGVVISNSEVGAGSFAVEPFTFDSFCTNGSIWGLEWADGWGMRKQHVGRRIEDPDGMIFTDDTMRKDDDALLAMAHDMVKAASSQVQFERMLEHLRKLAQTEVGGVGTDIPATVEKLAKSVNLGEGEQAAIMNHLILGGDLSAYGFWSAVTRAAEDVESYDRATELERVGGKLVSWTDREWASLAVAA